MKKVVEVNIMGHSFLVKSDDDEDYVKQVVDYVNAKIGEVKDGVKGGSILNMTLLAAMNIADDYLKTKERLDRLETRTDKLVELINSKL
ncbi:MAG: cell division protein ZapA [Deltaproteobacteria bacterium]|nr:cell division protein ZapA [Deltaproteobacteria bacterium]